MATTIQVVENLRVGRYVEIDGVRCEVEAVSFCQAITNSQATEELLEVMAAELMARGVIEKEADGRYFYCEDGSPLIADDDFED